MNFFERKFFRNVSSKFGLDKDTENKTALVQSHIIDVAKRALMPTIDAEAKTISCDRLAELRKLKSDWLIK